MLNLGKLHAQGLGVVQDRQRALHWYTMAVGDASKDGGSGGSSGQTTEEILATLMESMDAEQSEQ